MTRTSPHTLFTSPWRGEVDPAKRDREGVTFLCANPPHPASLRSATLPLQGRVKRRGAALP